MRRPWNIVDSPVSSIATYDADGMVNMNICTYMMAISRKPKLYCISIENCSKTLDNILRSEECVIQILSEPQAKLVRPLGKKSGFDYDKQNYLEKRELLHSWKGFKVLKDSCAYIHFNVQNQQEVGDHILFTGAANSFKTIKEEGILTFKYLVDNGIIL